MKKIENIFFVFNVFIWFRDLKRLIVYFNEKGIKNKKNYD